MTARFRLALAALGTVVALRLVLAAAVPLLEDEAYYWVWSRRLAAGYFDHPPAVAFLIRAGEALGRTALGVRVGPVLAGAVALVVLLPYARDPLRFVLLAASIPLYALGGVLATPDVPLLLGWALALAGSLSDRWVAAGLGIGLAGLGKYTGWGLWPLLTVTLLIRRPEGWVRSFVAMTLAALLVLLPNLAWNAAHDWASVGFQLGHGLDRPPAGALSFVGAQVGLAGPVFFGCALAWWIGSCRALLARLRRGEAAPPELVLLATSLPVLAFFTVAATRGSGEANWAAPAWLAAALGLANADGRLARAAWVAVGTGLSLSTLVTAQLLHPFLPMHGFFDQVGRGRDLAASVEAWGVEPVYTSRYQEAALLAFYADLEAYALPGVDRADQYDLWPVRWPADGHALFVRPWKGGPSATIDRFCAERGAQNVVTEHDGAGAATFRWQVYEVNGCGAPE